MTEWSCDEKKFRQQLRGIVDSAGVALMLGVGDRLHLFDTMAHLGPARIDIIANRAGVSERYLYEWLLGMKAASIVEHDNESGTWSIVDYKARFLTRTKGADNFAAYGPVVAMLGGVMGEFLSAFRNGGGVSPSKFDGLQEMMRQDCRDWFDQRLVAKILPIFPGLSDQLAIGIDVADMGCGTGAALLAMAREFPLSRFFGYDVSEEAVAMARDDARALSLVNVKFETLNIVKEFPEQNYDLVVTFDTIHEFSEPGKAMQHIYASLRNGGIYLCAEFDEYHEDNLLFGGLVRAVSLMHCIPVARFAGGEGLGSLCGVEVIRRIIEEAGFGNISVKHLIDDPNVYLLGLRGSTA